MLLNIHIKNMALIDEIDINFSDHLNILTGETGAGKSILIDSMMLALGGKTPKDFVRHDAPYGLVELVFTIDSEDMERRLSDMDIPDIDSGQMILSRKIIDNRSVSKVNGETVTITRLKEIASILLDLHAQHENQSLLKQANHLKLLDRYGHELISPVKDNVKKLYSEYDLIKKELSDNNINDEEKQRKLDLLIFEKNEIEAAALKDDEDVLVEEQYEKVSNSKNIAESLSNAASNIESGAADSIDRSLRELTSISEYDSEIADMANSLSTASDLLTEVCRNARAYMEQNIYKEEDYIAIENRLNEINHLKAKYGRTIEDIKAYGEKLSEEYDRLSNQEQYVKELKDKLAAVEDKLCASCNELTAARKETGKRLVKDITAALKDLNFLDVRFDMVFEDTEGYTAEGTDRAYFIISTNVGEEMKPLDQVASGGEISRIMLALKSCLAGVDQIPTLVFDEIDVGISGRTAQMVAEKINAIGKNHQVICITHLPQIAAMADHHYLIQKDVVDGKTITNIEELDEKAQIDEIARLIGGAKITDTVLSGAKEMKELAGKAKVD